jgi:hypothetical protein
MNEVFALLVSIVVLVIWLVITHKNKQKYAEILKYREESREYEKTLQRYIDLWSEQSWNMISLSTVYHQFIKGVITKEEMDKNELIINERIREWSKKFSEVR